MRRASFVLFLACAFPSVAHAEERAPMEERLREIEAENARLRQRLDRLEVTAVSTAAPLADPQPAKPTAPAEPIQRTLEQQVDDLAKSLAEVPSVKLDRVELHGLLDAAFTWNVADPTNKRIGTNLLRVNDPDHDTFLVNYAKLGIIRPTSGKDELDAGFLFEVAAGREVQTTLSLDPNFNSGSAINLANGYVDLQLPTPLNPVLIRVGRTYGWFGVESLDTSTNPNFSLSYFSNFTPFTNTGVSVGMDLAAGFRYTQFVVNGWDFVIDNNDAKSFGGQLAWTSQDPAIAVAFNWLVGAERNDNNHDLRALCELDATFKPTGWTEIRAAVHYGQEEHASVTGKLAKYGGALLIVKQEFYAVEEGLRRFAVAARGACWRDQGGSKTGRTQALGDLTGTFEVRFSRHAALRFEYRHDFSTKDFFVGHRGLAATRSGQDTFSVDAYFNF